MIVNVVNVRRKAQPCHQVSRPAAPNHIKANTTRPNMPLTIRGRVAFPNLEFVLSGLDIWRSFKPLTSTALRPDGCGLAHESMKTCCQVMKYYIFLASLNWGIGVNSHVTP